MCPFFGAATLVNPFGLQHVVLLPCERTHEKAMYLVYCFPSKKNI
jgi:hypothetical protein